VTLIISLVQFVMHRLALAKLSSLHTPDLQCMAHDSDLSKSDVEFTDLEGNFNCFKHFKGWYFFRKCCT